jgi:hypothetical protein
MATGHKVAALSEDTVTVTSGSTVTLHVFARTPDGDLIDFQRPSGGAWQAVNVSAATGQKIQGPPMFFKDTTTEPDIELAVAASSPVPAGSPGKLLLFHRDTGGSWTVEDVSASTGITYGGFLRTTIDGSPVAGRLLVLAADGHLWQLRRTAPSTPSSWTTVDISAAIGEPFTLRSERTIYGMPTFPTVPASESHFMGIGPDSHLVEFWVDAQAVWRAEDLSDTTSQPVFEHIGWWSTASGNPTRYRRIILGIGPDGHLVFIWGDPGTRHWEAFDASADIGRDLLTGGHLNAWVGTLGDDNHLVAIGKD